MEKSIKVSTDCVTSPSRSGANAIRHHQFMSIHSISPLEHPATTRLQQLLSFLEQDPANDILRGDAFEHALATGDLATAERILPQRQSDVWLMRQSNLCIAQHRYDEASEILHGLLGRIGKHPSISQNLGLIASLRQDHASCLEEIRMWCDVTPTTPVPADLQDMWLRCLHHLRHLDVAIHWTQARITYASITSDALGIASLIAIDAAQMDLAREWRNQAAQSGAAESTELLLAHCALALQDRDSKKSLAYATSILKHQPENGRAWSSMALAQMLDQNLSGARQSLQQATAFMPDHIGTWHILAWACLLEKDYSNAQDAFAKALALDHNFAETHGGLAILCALQGQAASARESIRRARGLDPHGLSAQYAQALLDGHITDAQSIADFSALLMRQITP
jgi:Flp pilus assembly protein TadD